jgi:glycine betaine/proline transport system ATP-binding protein
MSGKQLIDLRRNKMGMVFQSFAQLPHKTVLENIAFPLQVKGQSTAASIKRAMEMVELVSLGGRESYYPRQLSGGQQQRVGIARSLVVEPDIWLLDEPFSVLDPLIRKEMQDEFLRLQGLVQKTILFITHDVDEALRLADCIAIMKDGVIEQLDTPANIVLRPATDYVGKFTHDVPREKVLSCANLMERVTDTVVSAIKVHKDAIIATVAEVVLGETLPVQVVDDTGALVGILNGKTILRILFGGRGKTDLVG